jgi:enoyl-CoA hydratase/carnithine racemase
MATLVKVERNGPVLEITLDRPPVNAIDISVGNELHAALCELRDDPDLRAGIITGSGQRIFSAGWDLKALVTAGDALAANDAAVHAGWLCWHHRVLGYEQAGDRGGQRLGDRGRI